jgi:hypothetical protein
MPCAAVADIFQVLSQTGSVIVELLAGTCRSLRGVNGSQGCQRRPTIPKINLPIGRRAIIAARGLCRWTSALPAATLGDVQSARVFA